VRWLTRGRKFGDDQTYLQDGLKQPISATGLSPEEKAEALHWLAREAGLLSSQHDPHLPDLLTVFSDGDDHFVVMPYLEGKTIKEIVATQGSLPEAEAVQHALFQARIHSGSIAESGRSNSPAWPECRKSCSKSSGEKALRRRETYDTCSTPR
jgi:hypothetical protein